MPYLQYPDLAGRCVFISGGGSGIGAELVQAFAAQQARVCFCDLQVDGGEAVVAKVCADGWAKPRFDPCDVRDIAALTRLLEDIGQKEGPITVLLNNAGCDDRHQLDDLTPDYWDNCLEVNLRHQVFASQVVARQMKANGGGSIVNLGSVSWLRGRPQLIGYTTSKAAIAGMTRCLARELGPWNIRVNALVPGAIVTERQKALWRNADEDKQFLEQQCLKYRLDASHVARSALFLASEESAGMTGHNLILDAGLAQTSVVG